MFIRFAEASSCSPGDKVALFSARLKSNSSKGIHHDEPQSSHQVASDLITSNWYKWQAHSFYLFTEWCVRTGSPELHKRWGLREVQCAPECDLQSELQTPKPSGSAKWSEFNGLLWKSLYGLNFKQIPTDLVEPEKRFGRERETINWHW